MVIDWRSARHLPWGWWLRANGSLLEDQDGNRWRSVRDAFWRGRMNFPFHDVVPEQIELLLRVLSAINQRWLNSSENRHDLFGGDMLFWRFYLCWLASTGLTDVGNGVGALSGPLSDEGHSAMLMLQATRDPAWITLPMKEVVAAVKGAMLEPDRHHEAAFKQFESEVAFRRNVFAREEMGNQYLVTLTGFETTGRMPLRRVTWSAAFSDATSRDTLFIWLAERVDRWDDYAKIAYGDGASALTHHIFSLFLTEAARGRKHK